MTKNNQEQKTVNKENNNTQKQSKTVKRTSIQSKKVKQWSSIWWKWIIIWIWVFFIVLIVIIFFFFFYLTSHPLIWKNIWMGPSTIKSITSVFAWLLFWTLFIVFLVLWLIYIYKLLTKDVGRVKNWLWAFIVFILWTTNLVFWWIVFNKINNIATNDIIKTKNVLIWYVQYSSKNNPWEKEYLPMYNSNYPIIWPVNIVFRLNKDVFYNNYLNKIKLEEWSINHMRFKLDCWNWQTLEYPNFDFPANKYCLYMYKWSYDIKFKFIYDTNVTKDKEFVLPWKNINVVSAVKFISNTSLHNKNILVVWEVWNAVKIDLSDIPLDLNLNWNDLDIDFEWQNKFKKMWWIVKHIYMKWWPQSIIIKLPNKQWFPYYRIPIWIKNSTSPICNIDLRENDWVYTFIVNATPKWNTPSDNIKNYIYTINNITNLQVIKKWKWKIVRTHLQNGSDYQISWKVTDTQWKSGICKSQIIKLSSKKTYKYNIKVYDENMKEVPYKNNTVIVNTIPSTFKVEIWNIIWWKENIVSVWYDTDNDWQIDTKWKKMDVNIKKDRKIVSIIKDIYWNTAKKTIIFKVEQKNVVAKLVSSKHIWAVPLKIRFDASTSRITDKDDKIIYFDRDFGDGEKFDNTRRWSLEHTYKKKWTYIAKVTVETEKWYKDTATKKIIVYSSVNTSNIIFPYNLWGQVQVWSSLNIELHTSWNVKNIERDFGDGETFSCSWRKCINITHKYNKRWIYRVEVKVSYMDGSPSTTASSTIKVIK